MAQWYLYEEDNVRGPFDQTQLKEKVTRDTLVCQAGSDDWKPAGDVPELHDLIRSSSSGDSESAACRDRNSSDHADHSGDTQGDSPDGEKPIDPTLDNLRAICERAQNEELIAEYNHHWEGYDSTEQQLILNEMRKRNLLESG
ncbi:MAG: DUF4339 domain-containing protein [bacterium]